MNKLFKKFLEEELTIEAKRGDFDYSFNNASTNDIFLEEYKKFLHINSMMFYFKNRFVHIINNYEIRIQYNDLEQIFKIYSYAKEHNNVAEKVVIEFLYTYYWGISTLEYKKNHKDASKSLNDFKRVLIKYSLTKQFFGEIAEDIYQFYKELIEYGIANDIYIQGEIIERIFNNMERHEEKYNKLIEIFIKNEKHLAHIINRDKEKNKHVDVYLKYIVESLEHFGGYNCAKEMVVELNKENLLTNKMLKEIINKYVLSVNRLCTKIKSKEGSFIRELANINELNKEINFVINKVNSLSKKQKNKLRECVIQLLSLKRFLLSDEDYVRSEMHEFKNEIKIDKQEILKCKQKILDYVFSIYGSSRKDFIVTMGDALELYAEYPLQSMVSKFSIDTTRQIYSINPEAIGIDNNFKKFFDEKGKEYTEEHPKLLNKLNKGYYEELLKYLSKTFIMQQELVLLMLGKDFRVVINRLKEELGFKCSNDYATVVNNVLSIEKIIMQVAKKNGLAVSKDGFENINKLFEIYKTDNDMVNGLMYLNYTLYEKSGMNLRNNVMHGTIINTDLSIPLLVSFSGLIFASILLNAK